MSERERRAAERRGAGTAFVRALVRLAPLLVAVACAPGNFAPVPTQPPDKAIVYVYRLVKFFGDGVAYTVRVDGKPLVKLKSRGYIALLAEPGRTEFSAQTLQIASITLDLVAGETYYLRGELLPSALVGMPWLELVEDSVGAAEIQRCDKLPSASPELDTP